MTHRSRFSFPSASVSTLRILTACAALAAGGLTGCAPKGDAQPAAQSLPVPSFTRNWAADLKLANDKVDRLLVRGDYVFLLTKKGNSYVLSRDTGLLRHLDEVPGGSYRLFPPVVLKDWIVYPTTSTLEVFGINGGLERTIDLHASLRTETVGDRNTVYVTVDVPNGGSRVRKLDLNQRMPIPIWELMPYHGGFQGAPAIHTDIVYAADVQGLVYAVAGGNREPVWGISNPPYGNTFDARAGVTADVKADDVGVYVTTLGEGRLYCLNRINGQVKWQYFGTAPLTVAPVVTSDTVYLTDPARGIIAINKQDDPDVKAPQFNRLPGKGVRWESKDLVQILSQDEKYTFALRTDGVIVALDKKTGDAQFTSRRSDFIAYATNTKDGTIYACTAGGRVVAIKAVFQPGQVGELVLNESEDQPAPEPLAMGPGVLSLRGATSFRKCERAGASCAIE